MKIKLRKLWKGTMASVKDFEVKEAINKNEMIILEYNGIVMTANPRDFKPSGTVQQSKVNPGQTYQLMDIIWRPDGSANEKLPLL